MSDPDFAFEPVPGLPAQLPEGENLLWQGRPEFVPLAWRVFHIREVVVYFAILALWTAFSTWWVSGLVLKSLAATLFGLTAGLIAVSMLALLAYLTVRTTVYSITSRRVVMRIGIALPTTFNLPFAAIDQVALRQFGATAGDASLKLMPHTRLAFLVLWPHVRPWRLGQSEPSLRALPDAVTVSNILAKALAASMGADAGSAHVGLATAQASPTGAIRGDLTSGMVAGFQPR